MVQKKLISKLYQKKSVVQSFDKEREQYPYQTYKHNVETNTLLKVIGRLPSTRIKILDVACGTGRLLLELSRTNKTIDYVGVDTSEFMLNELKRKAQSLDGNIHISIRKGDAMKLPFKNNSFDVIYVYHLLWHLPKKDQSKILREMARVLKSEGYIVFDALNKDFLYSRLKRIRNKSHERGLYKWTISNLITSLPKDLVVAQTVKHLDIPVKSYALSWLLNLPNYLGPVLPYNLFHMIYIICRKSGEKS